MAITKADMQTAHADLAILFVSGPKTEKEIQALERLQTLLESITPTRRSTLEESLEDFVGPPEETLIDYLHTRGSHHEQAIRDLHDERRRRGEQPTYTASETGDHEHDC